MSNEIKINDFIEEPTTNKFHSSTLYSKMMEYNEIEISQEIQDLETKNLLLNSSKWALYYKLMEYNSDWKINNDEKKILEELIENHKKLKKINDKLSYIFNKIQFEIKSNLVELKIDIIKDQWDKFNINTEEIENQKRGNKDIKIITKKFLLELKYLMSKDIKKISQEIDQNKLNERLNLYEETLDQLKNVTLYQEEKIWTLKDKTTIWQLFTNNNIKNIDLKNLKYTDASFLNQSFNENNITTWSDLTYILGENWEPILWKDWKMEVFIYTPFQKKQEEFHNNTDFIKTIENETKKYSIAPEIIYSIIWAESSFWLKSKNIYWFTWFMQLNKDISIKELTDKWLIDEDTAKKALSREKNSNWKYKYWLNKENLIAGIRYYKLMLDKYEWYDNQIELALISYNRWPWTIERLLNKLKLDKKTASFEKIQKYLVDEWQNYVPKVRLYSKTFYDYEF